MRILLLLFMSLYLTNLDAQLDLGYQVPHKDILDLADAPLPPSLRINADASKGMLLYRRSYKSIQELSEEELRLAGLRINPVTNISSRQRYYYDAALLDIKSGKETKIKGLPHEARLSNFSMSPDQTKMAFTNTTTSGVELWVIDIFDGGLRKLTKDNLNANMGRPFTWMKSSKNLVIKVLPQERAALINTQTAVPSGPTISVNEGKKAQNRTYQDLLKNKSDEANFESLATCELNKVDLKGQTKKFMPADIYSGMSFSPDGEYFMVTTVSKPFSYLVPYRRFPSSTKMYKSDGTLVKTIIDVPLIEDLPKGFMSVRKGPRSFRWRSDKPATLYWAEAMDGGDANAEAEYRDEIFEQLAPFNGPKRSLIKVHNRFYNMEWGNDDLAIANDYWWNDRNTKAYLFNPSNPKAFEPEIIDDRNYQDRYSDPGSFVEKRNEYGQYVLDMDGDFLYRLGDGFSDEGVKPFVDKYNLKTKESKRLYHADGESTYEDLAYAVDIKNGVVLSRIESKADYPNYYLRNILTGELNPVTKFENPFKAMQNVHKEVINYKRDDGLDLSATLYLPVGYDKKNKEKSPMIVSDPNS